MSEVTAFSAYQTRSTLLVERERALDARRTAVAELRQMVATLTAENRTREEQLVAERSRFRDRKSAQDAKVSTKEAEARAQQNRVSVLEEEERQLGSTIAERVEEVRRATAEVERRRDLEKTLCDAREALNKTKFALEENDAKVMRLETRLARQELATDKRHAQLAGRVPQYWLPRVPEADKSASLEDTAGESVYLVDELA
ncbi:conserved hypothetical protein [Leishmania major strain Friedlin]|uniref:Uncharacterized protein n=1 Tax=Leishmania major TaxID=5664 RepID=Q4QAJ1_LEIMA|nr:conserved hypothetical protein [Leishmania major strain Friedlin]CAG9574612.1 hypothetical_protein_-_conserved [Leishmania major strain Friedlin]CAJ05017.1 conserved hypothetical protein [Leishmania major strain Friedlin]|eukprot:XP_001683657.1 conserved hypothetical protein [Leishmania major strain Friedlin]